MGQNARVRQHPRVTSTLSAWMKSPFWICKADDWMWVLEDSIKAGVSQRLRLIQLVCYFSSLSDTKFNWDLPQGGLCPQTHGYSISILFPDLLGHLSFYGRCLYRVPLKDGSLLMRRCLGNCVLIHVTNEPQNPNSQTYCLWCIWES